MNTIPSATVKTFRFPLQADTDGAAEDQDGRVLSRPPEKRSRPGSRARGFLTVGPASRCSSEDWATKSGSFPGSARSPTRTGRRARALLVLGVAGHGAHTRRASGTVPIVRRATHRPVHRVVHSTRRRPQATVCRSASAQRQSCSRRCCLVSMATLAIRSHTCTLLRRAPLCSAGL